MAVVVLIHPPIEMVSRSGEAVQVRPQRYPPLGLACLSANLRLHGHEPVIIDANGEDLSPQQVIRRLVRTGPDVVGLYCNSFNLRRVKFITAAVRDAMDVPVVLGGPHITHRPEALPFLHGDFAIRGDGEEALVELVDALEAGRSPAKVPGLVTRDGEGVVAGEPALIRDLDSLPLPARDLLPEGAYYIPVETGRMTTMATVRGCGYRCNFCALPNHRHYRQRSVENVLAEFRHLVGAGYSYIDIHDPTFTADMRRVEAICRALIEERLPLRWGCETRADRVDRDLLRLMKRAGCDNVRFGIESGSERVRNSVIGKDLTTEAIRRAFRICSELELDTMAFFMLGHPTETLDEMKETLKMAVELDATFADFNLVIPLPGSKLFESAVAKGVVKPDVWERVVDGAPVPIHLPSGVSFETLGRLRRKGYRRQYLSPRRLWRFLRGVRGPGDFANKFRAGVTILRASHRRSPVIW